MFTACLKAIGLAGKLHVKGIFANDDCSDDSAKL